MQEHRAKEDAISWNAHKTVRVEYNKEITITLTTREERVRSHSVDSSKSDISFSSYDEHTGSRRVHRIGDKLKKAKHEYQEYNEQFNAEWTAKNEAIKREFAHKMKLVRDHREIEDEELRRKFENKRDEIREEKARREEIEKHRILKVLHDLKETENER